MSTVPAKTTKLTGFVRPSVAVDVALLSVKMGRPGHPGLLGVLVHRRGENYGRGAWSLPGTFVHEGETLQAAALRALESKVGVRGERPQQLKVFDDPVRDDRGWVLSVAHADLVPYPRLDEVLDADRVLAPIEGEPPAAQVEGRRGGLLFDHDDIVAEAVRWVRSVYVERPDPLHLLPGEFTLYQLQLVHEAVLGRTLPKDTWRRRMESRDRGLLEWTGRLDQGAVGKPSRLFRRAVSALGPLV